MVEPARTRELTDFAGEDARILAGWETQCKEIGSGLRLINQPKAMVVKGVALPG